MSDTSKPITMELVAQRAGVSVGTVSKVLNSGHCRPGVAERVHAAVQELGYRVNPYARALRSQLNHCLGILIDHEFAEDSLWLQSLVFALTEQTAFRGYQIHMRVMATGSTLKPDFQDFAQRIDGLILFGTFSDAFLQSLDQEFRMPLITYGPSFSLKRVEVIARDMLDSLTQAVEHLSCLGHREMTFLSSRNHSNQELLSSLEQTLNHFPNAFQLHTVQSKQWAGDSRTGFELTEEALRDYPGSTVLFYASDVFTLGGFSSLAQHGISVPRDLSVVSFNHTSWAQQHIPSVTSLGYDLHELAGEIINRLVDRIENVQHCRQNALQVRFFRHDSTGPARKSGD